MLPLSVAIIAKNEADRLPAALASVAGLAAEVVVLDSGSTDGTVAVAQAAGAVVLQTDWPGHVAQKNRALDACKHAWVLCMDADERLSPQLQQSLRQALAHEPTVAAFSMSRLSWWQGAPVRHGTWYPDRRLRLVRRADARWVGQDPHDRLAVSGDSLALVGDLLHHPYRSLSEHLETIDRYSEIAAVALRQAGVRARWTDVALRPFLHIIKALLLKLGLVDGPRGWCLAWLGAAYVALKWTRLWLSSEPSSEQEEEP